MVDMEPMAYMVHMSMDKHSMVQLVDVVVVVGSVVVVDYPF